MDWVVFGDDWGAHPSTTQHLIRHLPEEDRVVWVNSMGMRAPKISAYDLKRLSSKLVSMLTSRTATTSENGRSSGAHPVATIHPRSVPWHHVAAARAVTRRLLGSQLRSTLAALKFDRPVVLTSTPIAAWYLPTPYRRLGYLRLDDYGKLPGNDPRVVRMSETEVTRRCDVIFVTAESLAIPEKPLVEKTRYLPQGVDVDHFATVPLAPPQSRVLGFFGLLAEWLDFDLIESVARSNPEWTLQFVGPVRYVPESLRALDNVRIDPPVPYAELPGRMHEWRAAWIPFAVNELTKGVNPLKLREYLAAGLPTLCTALPEAAIFGDTVHSVHTAPDVSEVLRTVLREDTAAARQTRRDAVQNHSWRHRALELRAAMTDAPGTI